MQALRESGLYAPTELAALTAELAPLGDDPQTAVRHLIDRHLVPVYQLRKIVHGKTAELFVGPYVIFDKLGEGGMGKVYRARDTRSGRVVALKVVRPHLLDNPVVKGRYAREVQTALTLVHPNIAAAYDAGEAGGRYYLALEFVDGVDLSRLVRKAGVLSVAEACEYTRQAALGLQYAHRRGFVHRDIKPSNVIVSGERHVPGATEPVRVKVLDMGLVRSVGFDDGGHNSDLTRAGTVVGTPDYMAPEQAKNSSTVDHRADLYALGGMMYFLLTGKPPFPDGSPIEKILKHQLDPPPPLQAVRRDVPADLARIVTRLMAKKPADRYESADGLAEAILPLTRFTPDTERVPAKAAVPARPSRSDVLASETLPPSLPTFAPVPDEPPVPAPRKVGPADRTPRPADQLRKPKKAAVPAPTKTTARRKPEPASPPRRSSRIWIGVALGAILVALLITAWLLFRR